MRRHLRPLIALPLAVVSALVVAFLAPGAAAKPTDADVGIFIGLWQGQGFSQETKTNGLNFQIGFGIESSAAAVQTVTVRVGLPAGLAWGNDAPDPTEGCTGTAPAVCTHELQIVAGTVSFTYFWDVVAAQPGFYDLTASVEAAEPDPNPVNNTATFRVEVAVPTAPPPGPSGPTVSASRVRLTPAKPRAGSSFTATVRVSSDGSPVRPSRLTCTATVGGKKLRGTPRPRLGVAACAYAPARAAKGQTIRGSVSFVAKGTRVTRRFSARLS